MQKIPSHFKSIMGFLIIILGVSLPAFSQGALPPPQPQGAAGGGLDTRINGPVEARGVELSNILNILQVQSNLQMVLGEGITKKVTFSLKNPTVREVLDTVLPANGLDYMEMDNGVVRIDTADKIANLRQPILELIERTFVPQYVDIEQLQGAIEGLRSQNGYIIIDPDTRKIIVRDLPEVVEDIANLILQLDVNTETRVFQINYGSATEIADQLVGIIQVVEGDLIVDYRNNLIIITDTPERLDHAQAIIDQLDVELSFEVIPLAFALPEDIIPLVEMLLTENGYIDYDMRTNRLIVQDIPSIIEQIKKMIELLDIATPQIWVETDIVKINNDKSLTMGTSASFGKDVGAGGNPAAPSTGDATQFFSFNPFLTTSGTGLSLIDVSQGNYRIQIDAMVEKKEAEVIASPRLLIQDGEFGTFNLGSQEPFSVRQQSGYYGGGADSFYTQQFRDVGTLLSLEVFASEAGYIELYINIEDTNSRRVQLSNTGEGLAVDGSFIETAVTVKSGRTVVLGGIINRSTNRSHSGVPVLSSIPILGGLFRNKSSSEDKQKLLIFITPKLVNIDDPFDFAQVDNVQRIRDLQSRGVTKFISTDVDEKYLDWSNEEKYEDAALNEVLQELQGGTNESAKKRNDKKPLKQQLEEGIVKTESEK